MATAGPYRQRIGSGVAAEARALLAAGVAGLGAVGPKNARTHRSPARRTFIDVLVGRASFWRFSSGSMSSPPSRISRRNFDDAGDDLFQLVLAEDELLDRARRRPSGSGDLRGVEADEAVAGAQRVVEEGEWVLARQRREPERELGEVHGHRVLVDAVEAALRDEAAGVEHLVLVRRDRRAVRR